MVAAIIANVNRDPHRRSEPFAPATFFPELARPEDEPQLPDDAALERKLMAWASTMSARPTPAPAHRHAQPKVR